MAHNAAMINAALNSSASHGARENTPARSGGSSGLNGQDTMADLKQEEDNKKERKKGELKAGQVYQVLIKRLKKARLENELLTHLVVVALVTTQLFVTAIEFYSDSYWMSKAMRNAMVGDEFDERDYFSVETEKGLWFWLDVVYVPTLWTPSQRGDLNLINKQNRPVGFAQMRQFRTKPQNCIGESDLKLLLPVINTEVTAQNCYPSYGEKVLDDTPYGTRQQYIQNGKRQHPPPRSRVLSGVSKEYFHIGKDYSEILWYNNSITEIKQQLQDLRDSGWFDEATRVVSIEGFTYNANIDKFMMHSFFFEISASGFWIPQIDLEPFNIRGFTLDTTVGKCSLILDILLAIYFFTGFYRVGRDIWYNYKITKKLDSAVGVWEFIQFINILILGGGYYFRLLLWIYGFRVQSSDYYQRDWTADGAVYGGAIGQMWEDLARVMQINKQTNTLLGFNGCLVWLRIFQFFQYNHRLNTLTETIAQAIPKLIGVGIITGLVFIAFSLLGGTLFGNNVMGFRNMSKAPGTLFLMLLGSLDEYNDMTEAHPRLTTGYLLFFMALCWLLILNMILAVIADAFSQVQQTMRQPDWSLGGLSSDLAHWAGSTGIGRFFMKLNEHNNKRQAKKKAKKREENSRKEREMVNPLETLEIGADGVVNEEGSSSDEEEGTTKPKKKAKITDKLNQASTGPQKERLIQLLQNRTLGEHAILGEVVGHVDQRSEYSRWPPEQRPTWITAEELYDWVGRDIHRREIKSFFKEAAFEYTADNVIVGGDEKPVDAKERLLEDMEERLMKIEHSLSKTYRLNEEEFENTNFNIDAVHQKLNGLVELQPTLEDLSGNTQAHIKQLETTVHPRLEELWQHSIDQVRKTADTLEGTSTTLANMQQQAVQNKDSLEHLTQATHIIDAQQHTSIQLLQGVQHNLKTQLDTLFAVVNSITDSLLHLKSEINSLRQRPTVPNVEASRVQDMVERMSVMCDQTNTAANSINRWANMYGFKPENDDYLRAPPADITSQLRDQIIANEDWLSETNKKYF